MRFLALACLLLLSPLIQATSTRHWIIGKWPSSSSSSSSSKMPMDELTRILRCHAFLENLVFVTGGEAERLVLEEKGFSASLWKPFEEEEELVLAQFNPRINHVAAKAFRMREDFRKHLLLDLFDSHLAILDSDFIENDPSISWAAKVETLSLSPQPIVPVPTFQENPLYGKLKKAEKNPTIASIISTIREQNMLVSVYDLSEGFYTRQSASPELREAQRYLEAQLRNLGLSPFTHSYNPDYADNICVDIPGKLNPSSLVVTGAHYDSRSLNTSDPSLRAPGAVDNGSGTAGMLEMARAVVASGVSFENTIRICLWTGEEQGLLGSDAYAKKLKAEDVEVLAYFNADMTGWQLPNSTVSMGMKDRQITQWLLELSYEITATYVPELPVGLSPSCCSDYISFYNQGYPSIGYFQNTGSASDYPFYHTQEDKYDQNNYYQMKLETQAVLAAVLTFAVPIEGI